jgi:hypothetical protein
MNSMPLETFQNLEKESEVMEKLKTCIAYVSRIIQKLNPLNSRLHELLHWAMHQARTGAIELSRLLSETFQPLSVSRASPSRSPPLAQAAPSGPSDLGRSRAVLSSLVSPFAKRENKETNKREKKKKNTQTTCM